MFLAFAPLAAIAMGTKVAELRSLASRLNRWLNGFLERDDAIHRFDGILFT